MAKAVMPTLPKLMHSYFHEWLAQQRNASHRTVLAYRDAWRLFLRFVSARQQKKVEALGLESLTGAEVIAFLQYVEQERKATIRTRNCRLAAIRSFFSFVADHEPLAAQHCAEVLRVPFKKAPQRALCYLESTEVSALLSQPDRTKMEGQRDHALISFLYNTGARIQEALDLRPQDVHLKSPTQVTLMGKGRKERISPIWPETAELLAALLRRHPRRSDEAVFVNRYRNASTQKWISFWTERRMCCRPSIPTSTFQPIRTASKRLDGFSDSNGRTKTPRVCIASCGGRVGMIVTTQTSKPGSFNTTRMTAGNCDTSLTSSGD